MLEPAFLAAANERGHPLATRKSDEVALDHNRSHWLASVIAVSRLPILLALAFLLTSLGGPTLVPAETGATDVLAESGEAPGEAGAVRVWQHLDNARTIYISVRRAGARWSDAGTVLLPLADGHSSSGSYRYGDTARGGVEVRVWQHVVDERTLYISARQGGAPWSVFGTVPLSLDDGHDSSGSYRYGDIVIPKPSLAQHAARAGTLVAGDRGVVILEWEGRLDATRWQYRLRAAGVETWSEWRDISYEDASAGQHRVTGLLDGSTWIFQVRGVAGTLAGEPSQPVVGETPTFDSNGTPKIPLYQRISGGRAWRVGATLVDIPAGMRVLAGVDPPGDPHPGYDLVYLVDTESDSVMYVATDFGAECGRSISPSGTGRDVGALFDRIIASAQVTLDAPPDLTTVTTGDSGVVSLRWFGAPDEVTRWEYRLRGPYPIGGPWPDVPWGEWMKIAGSDSDTRSHPVRGLPDGTSWGFQVRAVAGSVAGAASPERLGAPAVLGSDGIPQLGVYPQRAEGGRTWRLAESPTVIDVPAGLEVRLSESEAHGDSAFGISSAATDETVYVNTETGTELGSSFGGVVMEPPCGINPAGRPYRELDALFDQVRASIRLQADAR